MCERDLSCCPWSRETAFSWLGTQSLLALLEGMSIRVCPPSCPSTLSSHQQHRPSTIPSTHTRSSASSSSSSFSVLSLSLKNKATTSLFRHHHHAILIRCHLGHRRPRLQGHRLPYRGSIKLDVPHPHQELLLSDCLAWCRTDSRQPEPGLLRRLWLRARAGRFSRNRRPYQLARRSNLW